MKRIRKRGRGMGRKRKNNGQKVEEGEAKLFSKRSKMGVERGEVKGDEAACPVQPFKPCPHCLPHPFQYALHLLPSTHSPFFSCSLFSSLLFSFSSLFSSPLLFSLSSLLSSLLSLVSLLLGLSCLYPFSMYFPKTPPLFS